jgi:hypothetical protein
MCSSGLAYRLKNCQVSARSTLLEYLVALVYHDPHEVRADLIQRRPGHRGQSRNLVVEEATEVLVL